jgi:Ssp1 endopeptidase immunity protein Rap1a
MRFVAGLLLALIIGNDNEAFADFAPSANKLMPACRAFEIKSTTFDPIEIYQTGECVGIIEAIDYVDDRTCVPRGVTKGQMVRVVIHYVENQPARHHEDFRKLALEALRNAWPCNR